MTPFDPGESLRAVVALRGLIVVLIVFLASRPRVARFLGLVGSALMSLVTLIAAVATLVAGSASQGELFVHGPSQFAFGYRLDGLAAWFLIVLSTLAIPIAIFSIGYLADRHFDRRSLFVVAAFNVLVGAVEIVFVASDAITFLFAWEMMTLTAAALVATHHEDPQSRRAAAVYLVMSHLATGCLIAGFLALAEASGSLSFASLFSGDVVRGPTRDVLFALFFLGFGVKAGIVPLHVWLPEAHPAAPTSISALLSAVLLKTGIYGMVRVCAFGLGVPRLSWGVIVVAVGGVSAVLGVLYALMQHDMKRLLAYHSIENIGIIVLGVGLGFAGVALRRPAWAVLGFGGGLLHVVNHALFKALLFLGAGSVIHAMHEEQDIQRMGGLKSYVPVTYRTFVLASLAIAGIFPFSGFFSKDEILWKAFAGDHFGLWAMGLFGAILTAFYMFRLVSLTFEGQPRWAPGKHPHEAPATMTIPLIVLAFLSVFGGVLGIPESLGGSNALERWLEPVFRPAMDRMAHGVHESHVLEYTLMVVSVGVALGGILVARRWYIRSTGVPDAIAARFPFVYRLLFNKYYVDEAYDAAVVNPLHQGSEKILWRRIDVGVIDWLVNASARTVGFLSRTVRVVQTGIAQAYVLAFILGVVAILGWLLVH
jgi:NADH-quinone oxidoreductase subunit L